MRRAVRRTSGRGIASAGLPDGLLEFGVDAPLIADLSVKASRSILDSFEDGYLARGKCEMFEPGWGSSTTFEPPWPLAPSRPGRSTH